MKNLIKISVISLLTALLSCTADTNNKPNKSPKSGGEIKMSLSNSINTLFPPKISQFSTLTVSSQIYEGLVKLNPSTLKVESAIASSWEINEDASEYTFHLRNNVFFHKTESFAGRKVNANDIKECFTELCKSNGNNFYSKFLTQKVKGAIEYFEDSKTGNKNIKNVSGYIVVNDSTFKIELNSSFSGFEKLLSVGVFVVYPPEVYSGNKTNAINKAIGTGPFKVKNIIDSEIVKLTRNENYWKKDKDGFSLPYLDSISFEFAKNKKDEILKFTNKKLDIIKDIPVDEIENILPSLAEAKKGNNADFNYISALGLDVKVLMFNHNNKLFKNINVRKAFNYAINKEKLVDSILLGDRNVAKNGLIPQSKMFGDFNIKGYSYDPIKAKEFLALAGYPNGNGFPNITIHGINRKIDSLMVNETARMLNNVLGINVSVDNSNTLMDIVGKYSKDNTMDIWRYNWIADYPDPENFLQLFHGDNISNYKNETFSKLYLDALAQSNEEERYKIYFNADQTLIDDAAFIPLLYNDIIYLTSKKVKNFNGNSIDFRDFREVYIDKKLK